MAAAATATAAPPPAVPSPPSSSSKPPLLLPAADNPANEKDDPKDDPPPHPLLIPNATRVRDADGFVGTVLYVGTVASAKKNPSELYAGVAWDDVTRGRHDGSVVSATTNQIVRHFSCQPNAGSFLRLSKLDSGIELNNEALTSRYVPTDANLIAPNNVLPHHALTSGGRVKPIEFLGELQIRGHQQPNNLTGISLRTMGIARPPPSAESVGSFRHLTEMDLAGNLLSDWTDVLQILRYFPNLTKVGLASNRIRDASNDLMAATVETTDAQAKKAGESFDNIRIMNLNNCSIRSFRTVEWVGTIMPNLDELCLAHSDLSDIDTFDHHAAGEGGGEDHSEQQQQQKKKEAPAPPLSGLFQTLTLLDCSDCNLTSWDTQVRRLGNLPQLTDLILNDNPIPAVIAAAAASPPKAQQIDGNDGGNDVNAENEDGTADFVSLTSIQLAGAAIECWSDLDGLTQCAPNLKSLRFRNNPVTSDVGAGEARSVTIARLPTITYLNASPVSDKERVEAERRYVSGIARDLLLAETEAVLGSESVAASAASATGDRATNNDGGNGGNNDDKESDEKEAGIDAARKQRREAILSHHPHFDELMAKHRDAMASAHGAAGHMGGGGGALGHDAVNVTVRSMAASSCSSEPLRRRLPGSLQVGRLKVMCSRAFGLDVDLQALHFRAEGDPFPTELDDDENILSYYGVRDGAEILMNEVNVEARERDKEKEAALHGLRIEEQERTANALQAVQKKDFGTKSVLGGD